MAAAAVVFHRTFQVVHGVQVGVVEHRHAGLDVARHGQVEQQHGLAPARGQRRLDLDQAQHRLAAGGGREHHVGLGQVAVQFLQRQGVAAVAAGQVLGVGQGTVGHQQPAHAPLGQVPGGQFDGFAGTDQQHGRIGQAGKGVLRQAHGGGRHRHRVDPDPGVGARALGHREGLLEQPVQAVAQGAVLARQRPGVLHLPQDLWLAQHHRIEPGGDPEQVAHRVGVVVPVQVGRQALGVAVHPAGQGVAVARHRVDLCAVAGRQQRRFGDIGQRTQRGQGPAHGIAGKGHPFAQVHRRGLMVQAQEPQGHVQGLALICWLVRAPFYGPVAANARFPVSSPRRPVPTPPPPPGCRRVGRTAGTCRSLAAGRRRDFCRSPGRALAGRRIRLPGRAVARGRALVPGSRPRRRRRCRPGRARHPGGVAGQRGRHRRPGAGAVAPACPGLAGLAGRRRFPGPAQGTRAQGPGRPGEAAGAAGAARLGLCPGRAGRRARPAGGGAGARAAARCRRHPRPPAAVERHRSPVPAPGCTRAVGAHRRRDGAAFPRRAAGGGAARRPVEPGRPARPRPRTAGPGRTARGPGSGDPQPAGGGL